MADDNPMSATAAPDRQSMASRFGALLHVAWLIYCLPVPFTALYFNWAYARDHGFVGWLCLGQIVPTAQAFIWPYYAATPLFAEKWNDEDKANLVHLQNGVKAMAKALVLFEGAAKREKTSAPELSRITELLGESASEYRQVRDDVLGRVDEFSRAG